VEHTNPLFKYEVGASVTLNHRFVAHVKGAHQLQNWDLNWEVERSDASNSAIRPSVTSVELTKMVSGESLTVGEHTHTIATEVLEEINSDLKFRSCLSVRFGRTSLNAFNKELENFWVVHGFDNAAVNLREHEVAFLVFEGVVESVLGDGLHAFNERFNFI
jgi:hypothetical protein